MEDLLPLLERIKNLRSRAAEEMPTLCRIGLECIEAMKAAKVQQTTVVEHKGRTYTLLRTGAGSRIRIARPVRRDLFIWGRSEINTLVREVCDGRWNPERARDLERLIYTVQQAVAMYLDLFEPSAARKVVGTFFEAIIACALNRVSGLSVGSGTVRIPDVKQSILIDLGLTSGSKVVLLAATKTSTRERLSQPFVQKRILEQAFRHPPKSILIVIGDVQRAGLSNVQHTFTAGQFLLYWKYITPLDGVYYIDVPPQAETQEFEGRLKRLWQLFDTDLESLVAE
jgi:hypothetical protein